MIMTNKASCTLILILGLVACLPRPAAAQDRKPITQTELRNFDQFLDSHGQIKTDLQQNPSLIDDQAYLNKHPDLRHFLQTHPNTRAELRADPTYFEKRERGYEGKEDSRQNRGVTGTELHNFDEFLDSHAKVADDLKQNPSLVDDRGYLAKHPDLRAFLQTHPNTRAELRKQPKFFMEREQKYDSSQEQREHHHR